MDNTDFNRMTDKVRKIFALIQDPSCTPAMAANYRNTAASIMAKFGIDKAMAEAVDDVASYTPVYKQVCFSSPFASSKADLYKAIARGLGVQYIKITGTATKNLYEVLGFQSDIDQLEFLFSTLFLDGTQELDNAERQEWQNPIRFRISFWMGYSQEVEDRLRRANKKVVDETPGSAIVLYDRSKLVTNLFEERHPDTITVSRRYFGGSALDQGRAAGRRANLQNTGNVTPNSRRALQ